MPANIPSDLKDFIVRHIVSVEHLEVLLLLGRHRDRIWTVSELTRELRGNEVAVAHWLGLLRTDLLVAEADGGFRFQPSPENMRLVELLDSSYRERPVPIIEFIYSRPSPHLWAFSQAFKIRNRP